MHKRLPLLAAAAAGLGATVTAAVMTWRWIDERRFAGRLAADLDDLCSDLHTVYCHVGDWPHEGDCVPFEGYEAATWPLLALLDDYEYARVPRRVDDLVNWVRFGGDQHLTDPNPATHRDWCSGTKPTAWPPTGQRTYHLCGRRLHADAEHECAACGHTWPVSA